MSSDLFLNYSERFLDDRDLEAQWLRSIQIRVEELLEGDPGLLFSYLYRLDIAETTLKSILKSTPAEDLSAALSREIWIRQKERVKSRKDHPQDFFLDIDN